MKEAERFSGFANTFEITGSVKQTPTPREKLASLSMLSKF